LEVQVNSYVIKNIYDFLNFLNKMEQCTTFEGIINKFNLELEKKGFVATIMFFNL
jgi:hypothetical protein